MPEEKIFGKTQAEIAQVRYNNMRRAEGYIKESDYTLFSPEKRRELITAYVNFIKDELHYKPVKVFGKNMYDEGVSFRALFEFMKPIVTKEMRKHTMFFEARDWSDFSLDRFNKDVLETSSMTTMLQFKKALQIRIWNGGFTDEEILAALLPTDLNLKISDVVKDGKLVIPTTEHMQKLFGILNYRGGYPTAQRIIRRGPNGRPMQR